MTRMQYICSMRPKFLQIKLSAASVSICGPYLSLVPFTANIYIRGGNMNVKMVIELAPTKSMMLPKLGTDSAQNKSSVKTPIRKATLLQFLSFGMSNRFSIYWFGTLIPIGKATTRCISIKIWAAILIGPSLMLSNMLYSMQSPRRKYPVADNERNMAAITEKSLHS